MIEPSSKIIDDFSYTVSPLPAKKGVRAFARLAKLLGPAIASGAKDVNSVDTALAALLGGISEDDMTYFCEAFAPYTWVDLGNGKSPALSDIFEEHFRGRYDGVAKWLFFCLEVNFGSFFKGNLAAVQAGVPTKKASP